MCRMTHSYLEHSEHGEADVVEGGDSVVGALPLLQALGHRQVAGVSTFIVMMMFSSFVMPMVVAIMMMMMIIDQGDEFKPEGAVSGGPSKQGTLREPSVTISSV